MIDYLNFFSEKWLELMWRVTWQGGVFIGMIFLITKIFKRLSPTIKHLLWMLVIVKFLIMPFVTMPIALPVFPTIVHEPPVRPVIETPVVPRESMVISESSPVLPSDELPLAINVSHPGVTFQLHSVLFSVWLCGIIILIFGITFRSIRLKKDISKAEVLEDKNVLNIVAEGVNELRIRPPTLKISDKFKSPLACGTVRPVIIFPEHIIEKFTESELRVIIYHELAHIKRLDILTNWFQILTQILYFFNPLVWYANRQIRIEREQACDDWVLEGGKEERKSYADALLKVVEICSVRERFSLGIVGVSETFTLMTRRVKMIMDSGRKINTRLSVKVIIGLVIVSIVTMPSCTGKKSSDESSVSLEHYRNAWLKHLGSPIGKPGWEKEAAEKAVAEFQKAIDLEPNNAMFRQSLAFAFEKLGETAKAEEEYKKAIELTPQDSFLYYAIARLYAKDKNTQDKAISELKIAIQQNPDEALFHYNLAHLLYTKAGEYQKGQYSINDEELAKQAFEEVQEGNNKAQFTQHMSPFPKDVSSKLDYSRLIGLWSGELLPEIEIMRDLGKANMAMAKFYEAKGEVKRTEEIYLSTLVIGKRIAEQKPLALIKMLVGIAIDSMGRNGLEELYYAQGMQEKVQWVKEGKEEFKIIRNLSHEKTDEMSKQASSFWKKKEIELKAKGKDLLFLEASFVREMLNRWPVINGQEKFPTKEEIQNQLKKDREVRQEIWKRQDSVFLKWPTYENIADSLKRDIKTRYSNITESVIKEILLRAKGLNQKFWDEGDLESPTSYKYNYEARVLIEIALEAYPQNEELINQLAEIIMSSNPMFFANYKPRNDIKQVLLTLRRNQFDTIIKNKNIEHINWIDFTAAFDLLQDLPDDREHKIEVANWLINTSKARGWTVYPPFLEERYTALKEGAKDGWGMNITVVKGKLEEDWKYARRLSSFQGPETRAKNLVPLHEVPPSNLYITKGTNTFDGKEKTLDKLIDEAHVIGIARQHLFRKKPEMKQVQLGEPGSMDINLKNGFIDVRFPILSEATTEELEKGVSQTTYPTAVVQMDFAGKLISIKTGSQVETRYPGSSKESGTSKRHVRLVIGIEEMTFEGQKVTWEQLPQLLENVPNRSETFLELAVASDEMTVRQMDEARSRAIWLSQQFGFDYLSYIGKHPLGSK